MADLKYDLGMALNKEEYSTEIHADGAVSWHQAFSNRP